MNQTVKHPLDVDLDPAPQGKPVHSLACANIAKHRFYNAQPFAAGTAALRGIGLLLHFIGNTPGTFPIEHMDLSGDSFGIAQTF